MSLRIESMKDFGMQRHPESMIRIVPVYFVLTPIPCFAVQEQNSSASPENTNMKDDMKTCRISLCSRYDITQKGVFYFLSVPLT